MRRRWRVTARAVTADCETRPLRPSRLAKESGSAAGASFSRVASEHLTARAPGRAQGTRSEHLKPRRATPAWDDRRSSRLDEMTRCIGTTLAGVKSRRGPSSNTIALAMRQKRHFGFQARLSHTSATACPIEARAQMGVLTLLRRRRDNQRRREMGPGSAPQTYATASGKAAAARKLSPSVLTRRGGGQVPTRMKARRSAVTRDAGRDYSSLVPQGAGMAPPSFS